MDYFKLIAKNIAIDGVLQEDILQSIVFATEQKNGDFSLPVFKLAKELKTAPNLIAEKVKKQVEGLKEFSKIEVVGGFVNFFLEKTIYLSEALNRLQKKDYKPHKANKKTICIDYSSVNIAKPFHIGHLLTTAIGGSLYRIFEYLGYSVVGINHLGDWGTQFGKLIVAYKKWGSEKDLEARGIMALNELYVRFHSEAEADKSLEDEGRLYFNKIENGDKDALEIFSKFKEITLKEVEKIYKRLGVKFDSYDGESFFSDKMGSVIGELEKKGLLENSDGAKIVNLDKFSMPPCLILKKDGSSLYATRDLAAAIYRKSKYNFYKNLYVVAYQQNLHFKQVFKVLELMGQDFYSDCEHIAFGMVSLEGGEALSTRKGRVVLLNAVLDAAYEKALSIILEKNPKLTNKEKTAEQIGVGAIIYMALSSSRIKDLEFSLDRAVSFEGETGPYIQYTFARCCSILEKGESGGGVVDISELSTPEAFELIKLLDRFDRTVTIAAEKREPSILTKYLIEICQLFNNYYTKNRILGNYSREILVSIIKGVLKNGLRLLLIEAPEKM